ncbi:AAA family ATPase [Cernens ardua]|uniref:AAA family ATPase n=1 Tax=Cernens ardua TaxID=3402176 RepID=UPI003F9DBE1A
MSQLPTSSPDGVRSVSASAMRYPFVAVVGQRLLKQALILATIDPRLGGVLIQGPRGIAKTTLSRGLADLLPDASVSGDSPAFVELPLGTTVDRLTGSIDLQQVLKHQKVAFTPGLFHKAHEGVLYIDEVNLLDDTLVDLLLDVAAHGVNRVEREGISHEHAARFVLIGTMNPDEGELRPQLSDRFGLSVTLESHISIDERLDIVQQRMDFDQDPEGFIARHQPSTRQLKERISRALDRVPTLTINKTLQREIARRAMNAGVEGIRADIAWRRAALAHAAFDEQNEVTLADVDAVEPLVLGHRAGRLPPSSPSSDGQHRERHSSGREESATGSKHDALSTESHASSADQNDAHRMSATTSTETDTRQGHENTPSKTQSSLLSSSYRRTQQGRDLREKRSQTHSSLSEATTSRAISPRTAVDGRNQRTTYADTSQHTIDTDQTVNSQPSRPPAHADSTLQQPTHDGDASLPSSSSTGSEYGQQGEGAHLTADTRSQHSPTGVNTDNSPTPAGVIHLRNFQPNKDGLINQRNGQSLSAMRFSSLSLRPQGAGKAKRRIESTIKAVQAMQIDWFATLSDRRNHTFQANRAKENASASDISIDRFSYRNQPLRMPFMTLVMLDISASTLSRSAIDLAAQAVLRIADESRRLGHQFALLVFGRGGCRWICRARRVPAELRAYLKQQRVGGGTPLAEALQLGRRFLHQRQQQCKGLESHSWLITDGRAASAPDAPPWPATLDIIDTERGRVRLGRANRWATQLGARCCPLEQFMTSSHGTMQHVRCNTY